MFTDLKRIIDQISRDKGIDRALLVEAIEEAVRSAVRKKYGSRRDIEVQFNEELGEVEVFQFRTVVEEVEDEETEISLEEARALDPEVEIGDDLGEKLENIAELGRIAAQSAKQVIIHRMRDAEREVIYEMFRDRQGTIVNGIVQRFERGNMIVNLGRTDAVLPREGQIPKRSFKQGDRIRAYLQEVRQDSRDSQLILSRTCNEFLIKLFEMEVPEIAEGIVKIMGASREPGFRAKIAVSSLESDVDPVGACVGLKGSRVQNVVQELQGERIDIVPWNPDPAKYVYNALAPAEVSMVIVDEDEHQLLVVVPDDQLSLAIGRQGQNVRLASRLIGWRIDVKSETRYANLEDKGYQSLIAIESVDENLADKLFAAGICSARDLASADIKELMQLAMIDEERALELKDLAAARVASAPEALAGLDRGENEEEFEAAPGNVIEDEGKPESLEPPDTAGFELPETKGGEEIVATEADSTEAAAEQPLSGDNVQPEEGAPDQESGDSTDR
ncbi:transcription termination factor NusA [Desulfolithobacter sp.]